MDTETTCSCCGKAFRSEFWHGGSIEHYNYTNDRNMNVFTRRFNDGDKYYTKDKLFKDSITLDGNFCNIKDNSYKVGMEIFECRIIWLKKNGHDNIALYLESRRSDIKKEFELIIEQKIEEHEKAVIKLREKIS